MWFSVVFFFHSKRNVLACYTSLWLQPNIMQFVIADIFVKVQKLIMHIHLLTHGRITEKYPGHILSPHHIRM